MKRLLVLTAVAVLSAGVGCDSTRWCRRGAPCPPSNCAPAAICAPVDPCGGASYGTPTMVPTMGAPTITTTPGSVIVPGEVRPGPTGYTP